MKKNIETVMLGDSITARADWNKLLEQEHILNLGIDGDSTSGVLSRLHTVLQLEPKVVFLMIGINDLAISVPLDEVFDNYKKIVKRLKEKNIKVITQATLITQMPAINKKVKEYNQRIENFAKDEDLVFIDLNKSFKNAEGLLREDLTTDGLHLGQKAYKVWAYLLKQKELF